LNKQAFIIIIFLFSFLIFKSQVVNPNGYNIFYDDNGVKSSEGFMKNGKPDGYWKNYYKNGVLKIEGNRKNFNLDSVWKFYTDNGKMTKIVNYLDGKKNGFTITYDTAEHVFSKDFFINDIKQGDSFFYYKSGKVKKVITYKNGKPDGYSYDFTEDSVIVTIYKYQNGILANTEHINFKDELGRKQGIHKDFYPDGKLKEEKRYKDNIVDGYIKAYDSKGNLSNIQKFNNGKKILNPVELAILDVYKDFYSDGTLKYEGGYISNMPVGTHYHYKQLFYCDSLPVLRDDTSDVMIKKLICRNRAVPDSAVVYNDGVKVEYGAVDSLRHKIGLWYEYHVTGEFKGKGLFLNDKRIGEWIFYYPNSKIEQVGKYDKKGRAQGEWKWFYDSGNILRIENYIDNLRNGPMLEYTEDGKIITKGEYLDDLKEGLWLYETIEYKEIGKYVNDKPDSLWKSYYMPKEKLKFEGKFMNGDQEGKHLWYWDNGRKMMEGSFVGGMKQKEWKFYDEIGFNYLTIFYENDIEIKWQGIKLLPSYEESLREYPVLRNNKIDRTLSIEKDK
jgi:antitoxin component YwqK of YwqJK toxin-antitoxin module